MSAAADKNVTHVGGCHCRGVSFEVEAPAEIEAYECNCSVCRMTAYLHFFVSAPRFRLLSGEQDLISYRFNTGTAKHLFCGTCGIKSFYVPRSHPDGFSINVRCLDPETISAVSVTPFDGANWERNIQELPPV
ncbi:MAG: GFA family protein [Gammaproteobacteria bacterium]